MTRRIAAALLGALALATPASAMSVAEFLARADALKAKGFRALFARSEINALTEEGKQATIAWRAQVAPPGRKPNACPPPGMVRMTSDDFLAMLAAVPPAKRAETKVADATIAGMNRRYPCP